MLREQKHVDKKIQPAVCCALTRLRCSWCETDMTEEMLAKASRELADTGACRAFLVSGVELPTTDQSRVDQDNQIVPCLAMAGLTVDKDGIVLDINSEDSRGYTFAQNLALSLHRASYRELHFPTIKLRRHFSVPLKQRARHSPRSIVRRVREGVAQLGVSRRGRCFVVCASRSLAV